MVDPGQGQGLTPSERGPLDDQTEIVDGEPDTTDPATLVRILAEQTFSGPLPPPEMLGPL
jgi:hypothetical protein